MTNNSRKLFYIIMAVLVSLGAWMFVVYNYYPMTDVNYSGVPVSFEGQRELAARGLAVSEASIEGIGVRLNQKRVNYNNISAKDIKVTANVSECVAGENDVSLNVSGPVNTSVVSYDTDAIRVVVERTESEYMDIDVIYSGDNSDNDLPVAIDMGRDRAEVVCASSKLDSISRVAAVLNRSEVDENIRSYTANLAALDADGNVVPYAVIYPEEISLDACAGTIKEVALNVPVTGTKDENYDRKYTVPETVTVKGPLAVLANLESVTAHEMDISYYYENNDLEITLDLPENVSLNDPEEIPTMKLTVTKIEKTQESDTNSEEG